MQRARVLRGGHARLRGAPEGSALPVAADRRVPEPQSGARLPRPDTHAQCAHRGRWRTVPRTLSAGGLLARARKGEDEVGQRDPRVRRERKAAA